MGPKIALVVFSSGLGGTERRMFTVARLLREQKGFDVQLVLTGEGAAAIARFPEFSDLQAVPRHIINTPFGLDQGRQLPGMRRRFKPIRLLRWFANWITLALGLISYLKLIQPDLVHLALDNSLLAYWLVSYFRRIPTVISLVGDEMREYSRYSQFGISGRLQARAVRRGILRAKQIDVLGPDLMEHLKQVDPLAVKKAHLLSSFIETDRFIPKREKELWVVFAHRFIEIKNPILFIDALPAVVHQHPDARFYLLGNGPLETQIRDRLQELGLTNQVTVQFTDKVEEILSRSMIFLCLQEEENYPSRAMLEAMACGNAIIATDVGYTHLLVHEKTGIRVPKSSEALSQAMNTLLADPALCQKLGENARDQVVCEFSLPHYLDRLVALYMAALGDRR